MTASLQLNFGDGGGGQSQGQGSGGGQNDNSGDEGQNFVGCEVECGDFACDVVG